MPLTRVDFYLLENEPLLTPWSVACRLLEKAYHRGHRVFVYCANKQDAEHLDELLWTFKEDAFIPHNLQGEGPEPPPPVQIGFAEEPKGFSDILLNMNITIPAYYTKFRRIIEIVDTKDDTKQHSREHYRTYREKGFDLHTHRL